MVRVGLYSVVEMNDLPYIPHPKFLPIERGGTFQISYNPFLTAQTLIPSASAVSCGATNGHIIA